MHRARALSIKMKNKRADGHCKSFGFNDLGRSGTPFFLFGNIYNNNNNNNLYLYSYLPQNKKLQNSGQREIWRRVSGFVEFKLNLAYQSCVFSISFFLVVLNVVLSNLRTIMGGLTTEEFQKLLEKALEPLRKSIDEVKKSMATANSNYDQLLTKMSAYEKGMTDLFNENKSLKAELLDTTNQLKALKESFNDLEQYSRRDCLEIRGIPKSSSVTREDTNEIVVELGRKVGVDLNKEDISTSHCLPNKVKLNGDRALFPPAIIVKFTSRDVREKLYRARKALKDITSHD